MFLLHKPSRREIESFISRQRGKPFSYSPVGITRDPPAAGYNIDHNRARIGDGPQAFSAAMAAIKAWKMFDLGWASLFSSDTPIEIGATVAVVVNHLGFWSMNACRIAYLVEQSDACERYGFAYGTLTDHAERGEERFTVEWNRQDDSVWYDILAVSKPGSLARLASPYARGLQKRFANDSKKAIMRAVAQADV